ncbi:MAG: hypothetical protein DDT32_01968 [Syntrophomonadaceae bacterium]|nr:hypothetical protein [Bacillota bacterium]
MMIDWTEYLTKSLTMLPIATILWSVYAYHRISKRDWRHAIRCGIIYGIGMAVMAPLMSYLLTHLLTQLLQ